MVRLTYSLREQIISNAVEKSQLPKKLDIAKKAFYAVCDEIRIEALGDEVKVSKYMRLQKDFEKLVELLPSEIRKDTQFLWSRANSRQIKFQDGQYSTLEFGCYQLCPNNTILCDNEDFKKRFFECKEAVSSIEGQTSSLKSQVRAQLNKVNTTAQLIKVWKEAKELIPVKGSDIVHEIAIPVANLNALIGLPTEVTPK